MSDISRSSKGEGPVKFDPHPVGSPHDLMANRWIKSNIKKVKAKQKKLSRELLKSNDTPDQKDLKKMKEKLRKRKQREDEKKGEKSQEEIDVGREKERIRKRVYRS